MAKQSSPAQKRAQADLAAFRRAHGRAPVKGESTKGYSGGRAPARVAASSTTAAAPRKRRKSKPKPSLKRFLKGTWKRVKKNPVKSTLAATALGVAAVPRSRRAVVSATRRGYSTVVALVKS